MIIRPNTRPTKGTAIRNEANKGDLVNSGQMPSMSINANQLGADTDNQSAAVNASLRPTVAGDSPMASGVKGLSSFKAVFDNTALPAGTYYIGHPDAVALSGVAGLLKPTSMSNDVDATLNTFGVAPVQVEAIIMQTSSDPAQIQQDVLVYAGVEINRSNKGIGAVPNGTIVNPIFDNPLAARMVFTDPSDQPGLTWNQFITFDVLADEVVTVTVVPSVAWNRQR